MKILVEVFCELDPTLTIRIDRTTSEPVTEKGDNLLRVAPLGRLGVDMALHIPHARVTAFALGKVQEPALRHALAAGAERALLVDTDFTISNAQEVVPSRALAAWLESQIPDVVIGSALVACSAALLGWAQVSGVESVEVHNGKLRVLRWLDRTNRERIETTLPVVLRMVPSQPPRYIARARILRTQKLEILKSPLPSDTSTSAIRFEAGALQIARARTRIGENAALKATGPLKASQRLLALAGSGNLKSAPPVSPSVAKNVQDVDAEANSFVRYLMHHHLIEQSKEET